MEIRHLKLKAFDTRANQVMTFNGERANDIFRKGNRFIKGQFYIRSKYNHIIANVNNPCIIDTKYLKNGHKVHIFIPNSIVDFNSLAIFIKKCREITGKKVTVHVPDPESFCTKALKKFFVEGVKTPHVRIISGTTDMLFTFNYDFRIDKDQCLLVGFPKNSMVTQEFYATEVLVPYDGDYIL